MNLRNTIFFLAVVTLFGCAKTPESASEAMPGIQGNWAAVSAVINGGPLPDEMVNDLRLLLTEDRFKTSEGEEVLFDSTYTMDTSQSPSHINMFGNEGDATGKDALGIYSLEEDQLKICYTMPGGKRPVAFESGVGSQVFYIVWERL